MKPKYFIGFKFRWGFSIAEVTHVSLQKNMVRYGGTDNLGAKWAADEAEIDAALVSDYHPKLVVESAQCDYCQRIQGKGHLGYYCPIHGRPLDNKISISTTKEVNA